jgi:hypothetical protein
MTTGTIPGTLTAILLASSVTKVGTGTGGCAILVLKETFTGVGVHFGIGLQTFTLVHARDTL